MAKVSFKTQSGNFPELFPVNIFDLIPEDHPVRLVDVVVDQLDIRDIMGLYLGGSCSSVSSQDDDKGSVEKYKEKLEQKINTVLSEIENSIQASCRSRGGLWAA